MADTLDLDALRNSARSGGQLPSAQRGDAGRLRRIGEPANPGVLDQLNHEISSLWGSLPTMGKEILSDPAMAALIGAHWGIVGAAVGATVGLAGMGVRELVDPNYDSKDWFGATKGLIHSGEQLAKDIPGYGAAIPAALANWTGDFSKHIPILGGPVSRGAYGVESAIWDHAPSWARDPGRDIQKAPVSHIVSDLGVVAMASGFAYSGLKSAGMAESTAGRLAAAGAKLDPVQHVMEGGAKLGGKVVGRVADIEVDGLTVRERYDRSQFGQAAKAASSALRAAGMARDMASYKAIYKINQAFGKADQAVQQAFFMRTIEGPMPGERSVFGVLRAEEDAGRLTMEQVQEQLTNLSPTKTPGNTFTYDGYRTYTDWQRGAHPELDATFAEMHDAYAEAINLLHEHWLAGKGESTVPDQATLDRRAATADDPAAIVRDIIEGKLVRRRGQVQKVRDAAEGVGNDTRATLDTEISDPKVKARYDRAGTVVDDLLKQAETDPAIAERLRRTLGATNSEHLPPEMQRRALINTVVEGSLYSGRRGSLGPLVDWREVAGLDVHVSDRPGELTLSSGRKIGVKKERVRGLRRQADNIEADHEALANEPVDKAVDLRAEGDAHREARLKRLRELTGDDARIYEKHMQDAADQAAAAQQLHDAARQAGRAGDTGTAEKLHERALRAEERARRARQRAGHVRKRALRRSGMDVRDVTEGGVPASERGTLRALEDTRDASRNRAGKLRRVLRQDTRPQTDAEVQSLKDAGVNWKRGTENAAYPDSGEPKPFTHTQGAAVQAAITDATKTAAKAQQEISGLTRAASMPEEELGGTAMRQANRERARAERLASGQEAKSKNIIEKGAQQADVLRERAWEQNMSADEDGVVALEKDRQRRSLESLRNMRRALREAEKTLKRVGLERDALNKYARANAAVARIERRFASIAKNLSEKLDMAPSEFRPILQVNREFADFWFKAAEQAFGRLDVATGERYLDLANSVFTTWEKILEAGVRPEYLPGEMKAFVPSDGPRTNTIFRKLRRTAQEEVRRTGNIPLSGRGLQDIVYHRMTQAYNNELVRAVVNDKRFVRTGHERIAQLEERLAGYRERNIGKADQLASDIEALKSGELSGEQIDIIMRRNGFKAWSPEGMLDDVPAKSQTLDHAFVDTGFFNSMKHTIKEPSVWVKYLIDKPSTVLKIAMLPLNPKWLLGNAGGNPMMAGAELGIDNLLHYSKVVYEAYKRHNGDLAAALTELVPGSTPLDFADIWFSSNTRQAMTEYRALRAGKTATPGMLRRGFRAYVDFAYEMNSKVDDFFHSVVLVAKAEEKLKLLNEIDPVTGEVITEQAVIEHAVNESLRVMGDFTNLTPFEQNVLKRVWMFYPWMKHIAKLSLRLAYDHPGRVAVALYMADLYDPQSEEEAAISALAGTWKLPGGYYLRLPAVNPFNDALGPLSAEGMFKATNPVIRTGVAALTGYDVNKLARVTSPSDKLEMDEYGRTTQGGPMDLDQAVYFGLNQFPQVRAAFDIEGTQRYGTGEAVSQFGVAKQKDNAVLNTLGGTILGVSVQKPDLAGMRLRRIQTELDQRKARLRRTGHL